MRKYGKLILVVVLFAGAGALVYWQLNKKKIIRNAIENAVEKGADNVYSIRYDSSRIDELSAGATFYNLRLQSDSLFNLLKEDSASLKKPIISFYVKKVQITGVNIPGLLTGNTIEANEILIEDPEVQIILPPESSQEFDRDDSLQLYERLTGNFNSIKAERIIVQDGSVSVSRGSNKAHAKISGLDLQINKVQIDSTRNHENLINYFIHDMVASIDSVTLIKDAGGSIDMQGIAYSAPGKYLEIERFSETNTNGQTRISDITGTRFVNLFTDAFIYRKEIRADTLVSSGGKLGIYLNPAGKNKDVTQQIEIGNDYFNKIHIRNIRFGKTTVSLFEKPRNREVAKLKGLSFEASGIDEVSFAFNIPWLLNNSNWLIAGEGIEFPLHSDDYQADIGVFRLNKTAGTADFQRINILPTKSDEVFMRNQKHQKDHYRISLSNLKLTNLNFSSLLQQRSVIAGELRVQPDLYVYNDRTLTPDVSSKVGNYPQQMLQRLSVPVHINKVHISNGKVNYRERGAISKKTGDVLFTRINGTITQFSNMENMLGKNSEMVFDARSYFLGIAPLQTKWRFPLKNNNGSFNITADIQSADARRFSAVTEPLGMARIKSGSLKGLQLDMKGDDYGSAGSTTVLYNDLKIVYLEEPKGNDTINKKNLLTFVANIFTKDDNPSNGRTRSNSVGIPRDTTRSFFNLVWKSIFEGVKKTAAGKSM